MRNKITECPVPCSWKLPIWVTKGMGTGTDDDIAETLQESVHQSDEDVSQRFNRKVTKNLDSSGSTKLHEKRKKKDIFEDSDTDEDEDVHQGTRVNSSKKKEASMSVPLKVGKKKVLQAVGEESNKIMCDNNKACKVVASDKTDACKVVESDNGQEKTKDKNNVATVGDEYQNKVDEYIANFKLNIPMTSYHS